MASRSCRAQTRISPAWRRSSAPSRTHSTPTQRVPSKSRRRAWARRTHAQVGVVGDLPEVGGRRAVADAVPDRVLHVGDAVLLRAVVVGVERHAALLRGGDDRLVDRVGLVVAREARGAPRGARTPAARRPTSSRARRGRPTRRSRPAPRGPRSSRSGSSSRRARARAASASRRPAAWGCGTVSKAQSSSLSHSSWTRPGSWMAGLTSGPPASSSRTRASRSTRRRAATAPAEPEPTTMTSGSKPASASAGSLMGRT